MNWLLPGFLAAGLLVGLPVILHFLRRKPKAIVPFPSLKFLSQSAIRDTRKHRLRRLITLLLRCLAIGLLAAAFARPFFADMQARNARVVVIAVDNSMSMQARGRWESLKEWALGKIENLGPGDHAGMILMNPEPKWLVPISGNVEQVREMLRSLPAGYESTRYLPALRVAGQALASSSGRDKTLVWMADEQQLGWMGARFEQTLPPGVDVALPPIPGAPGSQAAITSVHWLHETGGPSLEVKIRLYAPQRQRRTLTVWAEGKKVAARQVELGATSENVITIPVADHPEAMRQAVKVSLDPDDLPADDTAWLAPIPEAARTVLYAPGAADEAHYLEHALASLSKVEDNDLGAKPYPDGDWPPGAVAIVTGECFNPPLLGHLNRFIEHGGSIWVIADGSPAQTRWLAEHGVKVAERVAMDESSHLRDWDMDHPVLSAFAGQSLLPLMDVEFARSFALEGEDLAAIANWPDGSTGLAEWNMHGHRAFISGFPIDRAATDWPLQPSFVPFVHQTVRWLEALGEAHRDWRVGDMITLPAAEGAWRAIDSPSAESERKVSGSVRADAPGIFEFRDGRTKWLFAVNTPPAESDLAPLPDPARLSALRSNASPAEQASIRLESRNFSDATTEDQQRLWWWLIAICAAALLAELTLSNRTAL